MSKWWAENMSDAGQGMFADPGTALSFATTPDQLLSGQDPTAIFSNDNSMQLARDERGGVMQQVMSGLGTAWHGIDGALSNIPGWGVTKNIAHATVVTPLDKLASGMYWLYSNYVSQPLSTALLMGGKADIYGGGQFFSGDSWSDAWHKAEHISPGQAFYNTTRTLTSDESDTPGIPDTGNLNQQQKQQLERFLYDSDYWRNRDGWKYTVGTGTLDFMVNLGDPIGGVVAGGARAIKAGRSLEAAEAAKPLPSIGQAFAQGGVSRAAEVGIQKLGPGPKTAEEVAASSRMNSFFDWAEGKSAFEIAQHPVWGTGRRKVAEREALGQLLANATRDDMPLIWRFAQGDNGALKELSATSADIVTQMGKAQDNRTLLAGHAWDADILDAYRQQASGGPQAMYPLTAEAQNMYEQAGQAIAGKKWQANYGDSVLLARAKAWQAGQIKAADAEITGLGTKSDWYADALGDNFGRDVDDLTTAGSRLFGTVSKAYRMGPLGVRDTENAADRAVKAATADRDAYEATGSNMVTRTLQKGFYGIPLRVYQSFGDRIPSGFVDHNADDAMDRVNDMLKQVPGLGQDVRLGMINQYASAGDKVARSVALDNIQQQIVRHMVGKYNLNDDVADFASKIIGEGWQKAMYELSGRTPTSSRFSAAKSQSGQYLDVIEDGYGHRVAPYLKSQLAASDPLLDVGQLDKILSRNSGYFSLITKNGGKVSDNAASFLDSFNGMWKASTLLRAGYALRAPSEEIVAGAVKFGLISAMADAGKGGANWLRNRGQFFKGIVGKDGIDIVDDNAARIARKQGLPVENVKVHKAFPFVQKYLSDHQGRLSQMEQRSSEITKKLEGMNDQTKIDKYLEEKSNLLEDIETTKGTIQEFTDYAHELLRQAERPSRRRLGEGTFNYKGQEVPQPFNREWGGVIPRDQISSESAMASIFARAEAIERARMIKTGSWTTVTPDMPNYMESWLGAINKQLGNDPVARMLMEDPTGESAMKFLKSADGRQHLRNFSRQAQDPQKFLGLISKTLDQYLPEGTGLRQKVLDGHEVNEADLRSSIRQEDFPSVHGEEIKSVTDKENKSLSHVIDDGIAKGFKYLGTIPSDIMSRQPIYIRAHAAHMQDLIDKEMAFRRENGAAEAIDPDTMNQMMGVADKRARNTISQVVYDPTRTTATQALRFVAPFMAAHIDGLERWFGLIAEKPELLNTASKVYNAPVAANMVTDRNGNIVDEEGYVTHRDEKGNITSRDFVGMQDRFISLKVPGATRNLKGVGDVPAGGIALPLSSLNTILPGDPWWNPGTGPLVQIAGSKVAEMSPATGDFLQWAKVLPYGPQGVMDSITPAYMKSLWSAWQGDDPSNTKFQQTLLEEYQRQQADFANGGDAPDFKKAVDNAKSFTFLKALTQFISPASVTSSPLQGTPYQFFVDQYKQLQQLNPKTAGQHFLATYGPDYYGFTASLNKSIGINSTTAAVNTAEKYKDLIGENPELAGLIVGPYNQGAFSQTANKLLQDMNFQGTQGKTKMTAYDAIDQNQKSLGWDQYKKLAGLIDAGLIRSGFHSYSQKGAEQFSTIKDTIVQELGKQYPAWEKDFNTTDKNIVPRRIEALKEIASDQRLLSDPMRSDIQTLGIYLDARDAMVQQLASRDNQSLTARDSYGQLVNGDLAQTWGAIQLALVSSDTKFNDLFNRYLANDSLQFDIGTKIGVKKRKMGNS